MSAGVPDEDDRLPPPRDEADADTSEVLDLDMRFGLSAFGPEQPAHEAPPLLRSRGPDAPDPTSETERPFEPSTYWRTPTGETVPAIHPASDAWREGDPSEPEPGGAGQPGESPPEPPAQGRPAAHLRQWQVKAAAAAILVLAILAGGFFVLRRSWPSPPATTGELTVDSTPGGARVVIGGTDRGSTPLSLSLPPGTYQVELRLGGERHTLPVVVKAGATTAQHVFLQKAEGTTRGRLRITSEPPSASVAVDGRGRGATPVLITDLPAGPHEIVVTGTSGTVRQRVHVDPGATTTVMVPLPRQAPAQNTGGWLAITAPTELQVFEGDRLLGTTRVNRFMLPTGRHSVRLLSESAGVDVMRQVTVEEGKTARLEVTLPPGALSINAIPWATVSIDGREIGETPLGNVELSPGVHTVIFTHPQLGERRQQVTVRSGDASRVSVDMRR